MVTQPRRPLQRKNFLEWFHSGPQWLFRGPCAEVGRYIGTTSPIAPKDLCLRVRGRAALQPKVAVASTLWLGLCLIALRAG